MQRALRAFSGLAGYGTLKKIEGGSKTSTTRSINILNIKSDEGSVMKNDMNEGNYSNHQPKCHVL